MLPRKAHASAPLAGPRTFDHGETLIRDISSGLTCLASWQGQDLAFASLSPSLTEAEMHLAWEPEGLEQGVASSKQSWEEGLLSHVIPAHSRSHWTDRSCSLLGVWPGFKAAA